MENYRVITKQIKELDIFKDASSIAFSLTENCPNLSALSDEHINTLLWLNTILPADDSSPQNSNLIAGATILGMENIKQVLMEISTLLRIEIETVFSQVRQTPDILLVSEDDVKRTLEYLQSIGLTGEQVKEVFFAAVLLDVKSFQERCDLILKYWPVDDLVYLAANCAFLSNLPYYDMVEAVTVAVDTLGAVNAMAFFRSYMPFFVEYRSKNYRKLPADVFCYENALKALSEYKKSIN